MGNIYLCGHTGSKNRGCDAIIRSTTEILHQCGAKHISAMTFHKDEDCALGLDDVVDLIPYPAKSMPQRAASFVYRKLTGNGTWGNRAYYSDLFKKANPQDLLFNVGGDTYCYGKPYLSYALNELAEERKIPTVFWGCSLDDGLLQEQQMRRDINKYGWIVVRESISYEMLKQNIADPERLLLGCDPAFWLPAEKTELPEGFQPGNTLGFNLSPLVFAGEDLQHSATWSNAIFLIDYVLKNTDMAVCLIPHVYDIEKNTQDIRVLRCLYEKYKDDPRVTLIDKEYNSTQLKYIISQCRFFIGARTHSMIAAYSTGVPALALSYSVKSLGIAKDLFGRQEGFAIKWQSLANRDDLCMHFSDTLLNGEDHLKKQYAACLPDYRNRIMTATQTILNHTGVNYV